MADTSTVSTAEFSLKINGEKAPQDIARKIYSVEVEKSLHLPDVFTIRFQVGSVGEKPFEVVDDYMRDFLCAGVEVEVSQYPNRNNQPPVVVGEITSIELDLSSLVPGSETAAVVRGYDRSHRLHRGRYTRTFSDMTYSEIVSKVARDSGLSVAADSTPPGASYVLQCNQTNWEFLWQLARRVGYELYMDGKTLCFKQPWKGRGGSKVDLAWGSSLVQFRINGSTIFQTSEVEVRGWDSLEKTSIIGKATSGDGSPGLKDSRTGVAQSKQAFGDCKLTVVDTPVYSQSEADAIAKSLADAVASDFVTAEGVTAEGTPEILPGVTLNITGLGNRLSGEYYVTSATHVFSKEGGYSTNFAVSGRRPNTLLSLVDSDSGPGSSSRGVGVAVGIVTNNSDEEDLCRVKVKFPYLGDTIESDWVRVVAPGAGASRGVHWLPEVNDEVLIAFEHGDVHRPYVLGGLWSKPDSPPAKNSEVVGSSGADRGKVTQRTIQSRAGHVVVLDDTSGEEKIIIRDKTAKNEIVINSAENTISINADKDINITAAGKVTVESTQDFTLKSSANLKIESSANIDIEAGANLTMKGGTQTSVEATGQMAVKGASTSVEGSAVAELKGGLVRIN